MEESALTAYYEALRRIHRDWEDSKCLIIARMALNKSLYGLSYTPEIDQLIVKCDNEIMKKKSPK